MQIDGEEVRNEALEAKEEVKPWVKPLARVGYAANGLVYALLGVLALRAAIGSGADANVDRREALAALLTQPLGQAVLLLIALGLVGYALGHFLMAARAPGKSDREGFRALLNRGAHVVGAIFHLSLAYAAARLVWQGRGGGGERSPEDWTAIVLAQPLGRWLVALGGLTIIGVGLYQLYKVVTAKFEKIYRLDEMSDEERVWVTRFGRVGYVARALVYGVIGGFVIEAAWRYEPAQAGGLGQALASVAAQPYGPWLLGAVALGFLAFGIYAMLLSHYRAFEL